MSKELLDPRIVISSLCLDRSDPATLDRVEATSMLAGEGHESLARLLV